MTYVDELRTFLKVKPNAQRHGQKWCHLWADSLDELLEFAREINLNVKYLQTSNKGLPHFDLVPEKRIKAIENGAEFLSMKDWLKRFTPLGNISS